MRGSWLVWQTVLLVAAALTVRPALAQGPDTTEERARPAESRIQEREIPPPTVPTHRSAASRPHAFDSDDPELRPLRRYHLPARAAPVPVKEGSGLFFDVLGKLALVVGLMFACAAGWKKLQGVAPRAPAGAAAGIQVLSSTTLGPQRYLHVIQFGGRQLLVGSSPQSLVLLTALDGSGPAAAERESAIAGILGGAALDGATAYASQAGWEEPAEAPEDRFEELLLRLRRLEAEQVSRSVDERPGGAPGRHGGRPEPRDRSAPAGPGGGRPRNVGSGGWEEPEVARGALRPGALFRSSDRRSG
jgi:flagellar biogenesis protein FliO